MKPIAFKGSNIGMVSPADKKYICENMPAFRGTMYDEIPVVISCHEFSDNELARVLLTRHIYLVSVGTNQSPVMLTTANPVEEGWVK